MGINQKKLPYLTLLIKIVSLQFKINSMKKTGLIITIILLGLGQLVVAQNVLDKNNYENKDKDAKNKNRSVEVFRDRLLIDVYQSFWLGMPSNVSSMKFNPGINTSILWDIKRGPKSPFSFGIGGGVMYHTQNSDAILGYDNPTGNTVYKIITYTDSINTCRLNMVSLYLPLEFRYRHSSGFKVSVGARLGYILNLNQRYDGQDLTGRDQNVNFTNYQIFNKINYHFDFYARIGWKGLDLFYSYQLTKLFVDGKGPQIAPMSIGITISPF
ncbi:MAG: PorT family protein [Bacteroidetes bacterium]|nr:PorT family protein [Bacteroidota bacterium]